MSSFVSVKDAENASDIFKTYNVPNNVYIYIRQLEEAVKHPELSRIKEAYSERFKDDSN